MPEPLVGRLERDGDINTLRLGPPPLIPVELTLRGDTMVIVDPSAATPSVQITVGDPVAATSAVETVLGEAAVDALWGDDPTTEFPVPAGPGLAALQRLALLTWLRWDSPINLDPVLLELDRAVALWDLTLALDSDGAKEAHALGDHRQVHRLLVQADIVALLDNPANKLLRPVVLSLVDGFLRENAGDAGQRTALRRRRDILRDALVLADDAGFDLARLVLNDSAAGRSTEASTMALLAGPDDHVDENAVRGSGFVDQMQIPRWLHGVLDTTPDAVQWTIHPDGRVDVTVAHHPDGPIDELRKPFAARLVSVEGEVLASAPLVEREDGEAFVGRLQANGPISDSAGARVDVFVDDRIPPAHGPMLMTRRGHLHAGWAFALQRRQHLLEQLVEGTDSPAPDPVPMIAASWDDASSQFAAADPELATLAADRFGASLSGSPESGLGPTLAEIAATFPD